jgi:hypothetical protein
MFADRFIDLNTTQITLPWLRAMQMMWLAAPDEAKLLELPP